MSIKEIDDVSKGNFSLTATCTVQANCVTHANLGLESLDNTKWLNTVGWLWYILFGRIYLQQTHLAIAFACWKFLLFSSLKTIENSNGHLMRWLYMYVANKYAQICLA